MKYSLAIMAILAGASLYAGSFLRLDRDFAADGAPSADAPSSPLDGRKIAVIGDSYVQNHRGKITDTWHCRLAQKHRMHYWNFGRNGNCMAFNISGRGPAMFKRYREIPKDVELIVVIAGHNDANAISRLKTSESVPDDTEANKDAHRKMLEEFRAGCQTLIDGIRTDYPSAKLVFVTPWDVKRPYFRETIDAIKSTAAAAGVPCYDAASLSGIDPNSPEFRAQYFQSPADDAHLNAAGHALMLEKIEPVLAAVAAALPCAAGAALFDRTDTQSILVASHRADWKFAPENSIASLKNAIAFGVSIVETDVRETKDGEIVIHHDATVDRTTRATGSISDMTLAELKSLWLHDAVGQRTGEKIPTLREYMAVAKGKVMLYLDKAGQNNGELVPKLLAIAREEGTLEETVFVLDWPYAKAKAVFGDDLERVVYCPVIDDKIQNLEAYVDEWLQNAKPKAFQFRMETLDSKTYAQLPKVLASGSRAFVAATWSKHTAGHDDKLSLLSSPSEGWGWLLDNGFTIIETNFPRELIAYLKTRSGSNGK